VEQGCLIKMATYSFNAQQFEPSYGGRGGLPIGKGYKGVISETEMKPTKDGQGGYVQLKIMCIEGPLNGQFAFDNLNLHNLNAKAVEIAQKQLSAYCHVTGVFQFNDTNELCNRPFTFDIGPQKNNPENTEITAIYDINGNKPGGGRPTQQAAPAAPVYAPPAQVAPAYTPPVQSVPGGWPGAGAPAAPEPQQQAPASQGAWPGAQPPAAPAPAAPAPAAPAAPWAPGAGAPAGQPPAWNNR
jgi:hypothetical protein